MMAHGVTFVASLVPRARSKDDGEFTPPASPHRRASHLLPLWPRVQPLDIKRVIAYLSPATDDVWFVVIGVGATWRPLLRPSTPIAVWVLGLANSGAKSHE